MSELQIRRIPFDFHDVDFHWNPSRKSLGVFANAFSFQVIGLERYFVKVVREAESLITDPSLLDEVRLFRRQEAIHAAAHRRHVDALIAACPALQTVLDDVFNDYDDYFDAHDLAHHLAYAAALEGTFTPLFKMVLDHRDVLLDEGHPAIASLFVWHFCEEVEHRSTAVGLFDHVVGDQWLKTRAFASMVVHNDKGLHRILRSFERLVPGEAGAAHYPGRFGRFWWPGPAYPLHDVPLAAQIAAVTGALRSLSSRFDHENQPLPACADEWFRRFEAGEDMAAAFGAPRPTAAS